MGRCGTTMGGQLGPIYYTLPTFIFMLFSVAHCSIDNGLKLLGYISPSPDPRCQTLGQIHANTDDYCSYLVCDYGQSRRKSPDGHLQLFSRRMPCAPGTRVPKGYFSRKYRPQGNPCVAKGSCKDLSSSATYQSRPPLGKKLDLKKSLIDNGEEPVIAAPASSPDHSDSLDDPHQAFNLMQDVWERIRGKVQELDARRQRIMQERHLPSVETPPDIKRQMVDLELLWERIRERVWVMIDGKVQGNETSEERRQGYHLADLRTLWLRLWEKIRELEALEFRYAEEEKPLTETSSERFDWGNNLQGLPMEKAGDRFMPASPKMDRDTQSHYVTSASYEHNNNELPDNTVSYPRDQRDASSEYVYPKGLPPVSFVADHLPPPGIDEDENIGHRASSRETSSYEQFDQTFNRIRNGELPTYGRSPASSYLPQGRYSKPGSAEMYPGLEVLSRRAPSPQEDDNYESSSTESQGEYDPSDTGTSRQEPAETGGEQTDRGVPPPPIEHVNEDYDPRLVPTGYGSQMPLNSLWTEMKDILGHMMKSTREEVKHLPDDPYMAGDNDPENSYSNTPGDNYNDDTIDGQYPQYVGGARRAGDTRGPKLLSEQDSTDQQSNIGKTQVETVRVTKEEYDAAKQKQQQEFENSFKEAVRHWQEISKNIDSKL